MPDTGKLEYSKPVEVMKMANNTGKRYSPEFKKQVVARVLEEGGSVAGTAKDFGLSEQTGV